MSEEANALVPPAVRPTRELIGVVVPDWDNPFFDEMVMSIRDEAARRGCGVVLIGSHRAVEREAAAVKDLLESRVDAIVLLSPMSPAAAIVRAAQRLPVLVQGRPMLRSTHAQLDVIGIDDGLGADVAVSHLVRLGHQKIAHIAGAAAAARRMGYERSMKAHGLGRHVQIVVRDESSTGGYNAARRLLDLSERPTAIFAVNDVVALGALAAAGDIGISIPDELSVVGFDDVAAARHRALTTVAQPRSELAAAIVTAVVRRIDGDGHSVRTIPRRLEPSLVVRDTTSEYQPPGDSRTRRVSCMT
jgi:DNA-binding LacI/PurR family transcriptional regulator